MTTKLKTELFIEDNLGNESIIYPFVESEHVSFDNGMTIDSMIAQDVSTPIVVHDTSSFKVGVGDSDISNSVVDSSVGSMTIKGQTYQNILPDPSLRNKTNGNAMQKFNNGYDSVNVVDGLVKSAILSGNTKYRDKITGEIFDVFQENNENLELISSKMPVLSSIGKNLFNINSSDRYLNGSPTISVNGNVLKVKTTGTGGWQNVSYDISVLPNTKYVLSMSDRSTTNGGYNLVNASFGNTVLATSGSDLSVKEISFTTPSNCNVIIVRFYCSSDTGVNGSTSTYSDVQLREHSSSSTYEPYKSNILSTPSDLVLGGVKDIKDTLDMTTGEKYEKTGEKIFNGSEGWSLTSDGYFTTAVDNLIAQSINTNMVYVTCDKYVGRTQNDTANLKKDG